MAFVPSTTVSFVFNPLGTDSTERALMIWPLGAGGTATLDTPVQLTSAAVAATLFGTSDARDVASRWFELGMTTTTELWGMAVDAAGHIANTWDITVTGTAGGAGSSTLRLGDRSIAVDIAKDAVQDSIAASIDAAINASTAPFSSTVLTNVVTVTSDYLGAHIARSRISLDLYGGRGEPGVDGVSYAVVNNVDATGAPVTLVTTNLLVKQFKFFLHPFHTTGFLDALQTWMNDTLWNQKNTFAWALTAFNGTAAAAQALGGARQDLYQGYLHVRNAPAWEGQNAIEELSAIFAERKAQGPSVGGRRVVIPMARPTDAEPPDAENTLAAGVTAVEVQGTTVRAPRIVNNRRLDTNLNKDLRFYDIGLVLATRDVGETFVEVGDVHLGHRIVPDGARLTPQASNFSVSTSQLQAELVAALLVKHTEGIIGGPVEDVEAMIQDVVVTQDGGVDSGFDVLISTALASKANNLSILVTLLPT